MLRGDRSWRFPCSCKGNSQTPGARTRHFWSTFSNITIHNEASINTRYLCFRTKKSNVCKFAYFFFMESPHTHSFLVSIVSMVIYLLSHVHCLIWFCPLPTYSLQMFDQHNKIIPKHSSSRLMHKWIPAYMLIRINRENA